MDIWTLDDPLVAAGAEHVAEDVDTGLKVLF